MELTIHREFNPSNLAGLNLSVQAGLGPHSKPVKDHGEDEATCIANISPIERRKRLIAGIIPFVLAIVILAVLIFLGADRLWRLPLLLLFWAAGSGFFQWRDKT